MEPIIVNAHVTKEAGETVYTDIAQTSLYNATISVINSERTAIWQRFSSMLVANSVVFGFLVKQSSFHDHIVLVGSFLGMILCFFWWLLTKDGWRYFNVYSNIAMRFQWPSLGGNLNVSKIMDEEFQQTSQESGVKFINKFNNGDRIKTSAYAVIFSFSLLYIFIFLYSFYKIYWNVIWEFFK